MNIFLLVAIVIICLAIGFLSGMLVAGYHREGTEPDKHSGPIVPEYQELLAPLPPPAPQYTPTPKLAETPTFTSAEIPPPPIPPTANVPQSMVEQINDILQKDLLASPLRNTFIKISELPEGIVVWVENHSYPGVDAMPAGEARDLVQAAVRKWELR